MKLTKIERIVLNFYLFMKRPRKDIEKLLKRFQVRRLTEKKTW